MGETSHATKANLVESCSRSVCGAEGELVGKDRKHLEMLKSEPYKHARVAIEEARTNSPRKRLGLKGVDLTYITIPVQPWLGNTETFFIVLRGRSSTPAPATESLQEPRVGLHSINSKHRQERYDIRRDSM